MKILCKLPKWLGGGHKRGRREFSDLATLTVTFRCPRCKATWKRKVDPVTLRAAA